MDLAPKTYQISAHQNKLNRNNRKSTEIMSTIMKPTETIAKNSYELNIKKSLEKKLIAAKSNI